MIDFHKKQTMQDKLKVLSDKRYAQWFSEKAFLALQCGTWLRKQKKKKVK